MYFNIRENHDNSMNSAIRYALKKRENIIFETTGSNKYDWLFEKINKYFLSQIRKDYIIIVIYPYVYNNIILSCALKRFIKRVVLMKENGLNINSTNKYIDKYSKKIFSNELFLPPRLPILSYHKFSLKNSINSIQNNISYYLNKCKDTTLLSDLIIIYDNTNTPNIILEFFCKKTIDKNYCSEFIKFISKVYKKKINNNLIKSIIDIALKNCSEKSKIFLEQIKGELNL